jgi:DNA invertase Pin-like site-specific DNA recombinase
MEETRKRVYTLYRVSTKGQVDKNDIPMQKIRCREFAERQGWEIIREVSELGVSGFKVATKDRDAIQEIQQDAALGKFDILLVFMFDRLGRRDNETSLVVVTKGRYLPQKIGGRFIQMNSVRLILSVFRGFPLSGLPR